MVFTLRPLQERGVALGICSNLVKPYGAAVTRLGAYHAKEEYGDSEMDHTLSSFLERLQAPD